MLPRGKPKGSSFEIWEVQQQNSSDGEARARASAAQDTALLTLAGGHCSEEIGSGPECPTLFRATFLRALFQERSDRQMFPAIVPKKLTCICVCKHLESA